MTHHETSAPAGAPPALTSDASDPRWRVLKFGGSSLGTPERLERVLALIEYERNEGPVAVIVSAMGDSTDWLIEAADVASRGDAETAEAIVDRVADLATTNGLVCLQSLAAQGRIAGARPELLAHVRELLTPLRRLLYGVSLVRECTTQTMDLVMSFGERLSSLVTAELLASTGTPALAVDARSFTVTDATFGQAIVDWPATADALTALSGAWQGQTPIVTGFLGSTPDGRTTTLGRNGSDYSATLLARGLAAREVVRYTDVSGVMTADPEIVRDAYPLARLSYMEALELANFGARVFHPRTMIPLIESGIPMRIRNTMHPEEAGTVVDAKGSTDRDSATSVTSLEKLALIGIEWRRVSFTQPVQLGERALTTLERAGVTVWMANQAAHGQAVAVVVPMAQVGTARAALERELAAEMDRNEIPPLHVQQPVTLLSLVAEAMGHTVNVAGRFFHALGQAGVNIRAIAQGASSRSISCVVDAAETQVAVRTVHGAFNFAHQEIAVLVLGVGTVGRALLEQIHAQNGFLRDRHGVRIRVVGIATSERLLWDDEGLGLDDAAARVRREGEPRPATDALLDRLRRLPTPVLVDVTAADGMHEVYEAALARGIHVVAANKKPLTIPGQDLAALQRRAREAYRSWRYETTVGASLPVIDTLKNLVRTGDTVLQIEGSFSGTLGYLTNELMAGAPLATCVRTARELGYTEPNPADDLSGLDVARKALILARELGVALELEDIEITPLVPPEVLEKPDVDSFFRALEAWEPTMTARIAAFRDEGRTLRYLARIAPDDDGRFRVVVGPVGIPASNPATRLRGAESFVAFTTERFRDYPLIVQGAGAGGAVTAAGVLADILSIPMSFRPR